jgi:hypothetical protein
MSDSAVISTSKGIYIRQTSGVQIIDRVTIGNYSGSGTANVGFGIQTANSDGSVVKITNCHFEFCDVQIYQSTPGCSVDSITGNPSNRVAFQRGSTSSYNTVLHNIYSLGTPQMINDLLTGYSTANGPMWYVESNGLETVMSSIAGLTWTLPMPINHSGRFTSTGTLIGPAMSTLTVGTAITLPAGNLFGTSTSPAGATTVTSFATVNNGRRITLIGQAGTLTINSGNNIWTPGGTNKTLNVKDVAEFHCIGTTWVLLANPTAVS